MIRLRVGARITHVQYGTGVVERCDHVPEGIVVGRFGSGLQLRRVQQRHLLELNPSAQAEWIIAQRRTRAEFAKEVAQQREQNRLIKIKRKEQDQREQKESERKLREEAAQQRERQLREEAAQQRERDRLAKIKEEWLGEIENYLEDDFLGAQTKYRNACSEVISEEEFDCEKIAFLKSWFLQHAPISKTNEKFILDDEQLAAIAAVNGNIQVVARAGSGKTATLVHRAFFLIKHCRVAADDLLMLAFNKKAASEIRRRLLMLLHKDAESEISNEINRSNSGRRQPRNGAETESHAVNKVAKRLNITLPHVMTFHALAYAIVHPKETLLSDDAEGANQGLSRSFQKVIDDHLQKPDFKAKVREVMLAHFRTDWEKIVEGGYEKNQEEFLQIRRFLPKESIDGKYCKSYGEKVIADFLFEHDVEYKYEQNHSWSGINYRPDFTIYQKPKSGIIIEYFGLAGDVDYDEMSEQKRQYWKSKAGWTLIEFTPRDIVQGDIHSRLKTYLKKYGIKCARLSEEEIWLRAKERAIDRFTKAMVRFIGRCRQQSWDTSDLRSKIDAHSLLLDGENIEEKFLDLGYTLYVAYLQRLSSHDEEDFNGLMQQAVTAICEGQTAFQRKLGGGDLSALRYIFIDEFQDFTDLFNRLLSAIMQKNSSVELFCVGDDWQAINGFAGSDLRFFTHFESNFGEARKIDISRNYRSHRAIVSIGNALMIEFGKPAIANSEESGRVLLSDINKFTLTVVERKKHKHDAITPAVLRVVHKALADGLDVVMLCRKNFLKWPVNYQVHDGALGQGLERYLNLIRSFFSKELRERITISTAHKYKGLGKSMVIVLDAIADSYPLIHSSWIFLRIFGESPEKIMGEERRLLYVALTRAKKTLVIFTDGRKVSPFLEELEGKHVTKMIDWREFPAADSGNNCLCVHLGNRDGYDAKSTVSLHKKHDFKGMGYGGIRRNGKFVWTKTLPAQGIDAALKSEPWAVDAKGVDVRIFDEAEEKLIRHYQVDKGKWQLVPSNEPGKAS